MKTLYGWLRPWLRKLERVVIIVVHILLENKLKNYKNISSIKI